MNLPGAIVFVNGNTSTGILDKLKSQLEITDSITAEEYDARLTVDPNYYQIIHTNKLRVLATYTNSTINNKDFIDIILFVKNGLAAVLKNNNGPPGLTYQVDRINVYELLRYNNSSEVQVLPTPVAPVDPVTCCDSNPACNCYGLGGIFAIESVDQSGVNCPNSDNIYNNSDFLNRK